MSNRTRNLPHFYLRNNGKSERYRPRGVAGNAPPPNRDHQKHAEKLKQAIEEAIVKANQQLNSREPDIAIGEPGFYLEFQIQADKANIFENLANKLRKIELFSVKSSPKSSPEQENFVQATVFVPENAKEFFLKKIEQYSKEETPNGKPRNEPLIARVETLQIGTVQSLFTDEPSLFPESGQAMWWEVWLRSERSESFQEIAHRLDLQLKPQKLSFPEREIFLVMANEQQIKRIINNSDVIVELRKADEHQIEKNINNSGVITESQKTKDTPSIFLEMPSIEQEEWVKELGERILSPHEDAVAVCLLDTGVDWKHRLIEPGLDIANLHTCEPSWGTHDHKGHGTQMAGLILYSDLFHALQATDLIPLVHCLESVKILPPYPYRSNNPQLYGAITEQAVSLPEIQNPRRKRIFCMAITNPNKFQNRGLPSSWSAAIDKLCFNFGEDDFRRLIIISAGNIRDRDINASDYPNLNDVEQIEDPGQAWNALIVGAYTEKINIIHPNFQGWQPVAPSGDLSPRSRTSVSWDNQWPIRPDVVFEGGNLASDGQNPAQNIDDLSLLTTRHIPNYRSFDYMSDTSCATALVSYMAARILSEKPKYWPETIRALIVHSAEWTPAMQNHFSTASTQVQKRSLLRRYGYGVPSLERALKSANNDLTLIIEDQVKPLFLEGSGIKTGDMNFHNLPWPTEKLQELGEVEVKLKVTLSYFIEPNPGERGRGRKHRYASYGLRFDVKRPEETNDNFKLRINQATKEEENNLPIRTDDKNWFLGANLRKQGSIHSDVWNGSAADLAARGMLCIYPVGGWWKEKKELKRWDQIARYSLIVTIQVPEVDVDIYTSVSNLINVPTEIETETEIEV
jgi:hypothetical protein